MNKTKTTKFAYFYWLTIFLGIAGIHRFYAGKKITGTIWLFSFGLLGIGQLVDLVLIPRMIEKQNTALEDDLLHYEVL